MDTIRKQALHARRNLSIEERERASQLICERVCASREYYAAKTIACYLPMDDEVDTREIIERAWRANKRVFVPILRGRAQMLFCEINPQTRLEKNRFGIWEPARGFLIPPEKLDVVIAPTVAFDDNANRIGMGGGFYDRCFSFLRRRRYWLKPRLIGVAFDCQKVEKITPNAWDVRLYRVVSDK